MIKLNNNYRIRTIISLIPIILVSNACAQHLPKEPAKNIAPQQEVKITEKQAIEIAEKFVHDNGYTDFCPDPKNIQREAPDFGETSEQELAERQNSLNPKAYGVQEFANHWAIVFTYSDKFKKELGLKSDEPSATGRVLKMDKYGHDIRLEHKDFLLRFVRKRL